MSSASPPNAAATPAAIPQLSSTSETNPAGDGAAIFRACRHLYALTLRRQFFSRQTLVCLGLSLVMGAIVFAWTLQPNRTSKKLAEQVLIATFVGFLTPIFAISYGAACIGGEREDRTLIYLLITPIPRPLAHFSKALATLTLVAGWSLATLGSFCLVSGANGRELFPIFVWPALAGVAAYTSLFLLIGTAFRYGTIISLAYWFFLEVLFGAMPGIVKRVTVSFYIKSWIYDAGSDLRLGPLGKVARQMFLAVSGETAAITLLSATVIFLALGAYLFGRREYAELG